MYRFLGLLLLLLPMSTTAQSSLPACPGAHYRTTRTACHGEQSFQDSADLGNYVGEFRDGKREGRGSLNFGDDWHYIGEFREGKRTGRGTLTWAKSYRYVGEFLNDRRDGQGVQTDNVGSIYVGDFKNNLPDGKGTHVFPDGSRHVGNFKRGKINGEGITYNQDGSPLRSGLWKDGQLLKSYSLNPTQFPFATPTGGGATSFQLNDEISKLQQEILELRQRRERQSNYEPPDALHSTSPQGTAITAHALVIGNGAYKGSARLENPINDAKAIAEKLRLMGFTVTLVTDANPQLLVQALAQFRKTASSADLSLLFYSGHGVQIFGTNYLLPTDLDQSDVAQATIQGVSLTSVVENFLPGRSKIVFLDACRDNPFMRSSDRGTYKGLAPVAVAEGTLIAYATKDGQTALDGVGQRNSPFTQALLEHLSDPTDIAVVLTFMAAGATPDDERNLRVEGSG
jgi:Caspase domain/MORN repeat